MCVGTARAQARGMRLARHVLFIALSLSAACTADGLGTGELSEYSCAGKCDGRGGQPLEGARYAVDLEAATRNWHPPTPFATVEDMFRVNVMIGEGRSI